MRLALSSLLLLPLLSVASASSQVFLSSPQVYLHPTPPSTSSPPTLTEEQAQAVIGHHLGASRHHQLPALGDWTKLLGVGHGVVGMKTGEEKARVLVVQGVGYPEDFAPASTKPTFVLDPLASTTEFVSPFLYKAHSFLAHALNAISKVHMPKFMLDIFDLLPTEATHALKQELETLSSWAEGLIPAKDDGETFDALEVKGLEGVSYGGEEYEAAAGVVKGAVAQMTASQTPFILILLPAVSSDSQAAGRRALPHVLGAAAGQPELVARQKKHDPIPSDPAASSSSSASATKSAASASASVSASSASLGTKSASHSSASAKASSSSAARASSSSAARASSSSVARVSSSVSSGRRPAPTSSPVPQYLGTVFSTSLCLTSEKECNEYTDSCGGKGQCGVSSRAGKECWTCSCGVSKDENGKDTKWSGVACEKKDISDIFILIVLTTLLIGAITIGAIGLLYTVGAQPLPSVLTAGGVPGSKKD